MDSRRIRFLNRAPWGRGPIIYWMIRDHRVNDNWGLLHAQSLALDLKRPLRVLATPLTFANVVTQRQAQFLHGGLRPLRDDLKRLNVSFDLMEKATADSIVKYVKEHNAAGLVCDFFPLLHARQTITEVADTLEVPLHQVDTHNIVPCWETSQKQEYAAYTIRPKINRLLDSLLTDIPTPVKHPFGNVSPVQAATSAARVFGKSVAPVNWLAPGEEAARRQLDKFLASRLSQYADGRNDPTKPAQSDLSPYLHFGFIAPQRVALEAQKHDSDIRSQESFLEELIVRRELSDNYCNYNDEYMSPGGFSNWAQESLRQHQSDPRSYLYALGEFEQGETHDELWNAAQLEMVVTGKMHGYMRMYWAKKILEWTPNAEEAMQIAVHLNDKYSLDGNDPNGYSGIAWSIGGVHDRPWFNREIFGKIRFMSYSGCKRKFDVAKYVERIGSLTEGGVHAI